MKILQNAATMRLLPAPEPVPTIINARDMIPPGS
jgi:hypothetical protein